MRVWRRVWDRFLDYVRDVWNALLDFWDAVWAVLDGVWNALRRTRFQKWILNWKPYRVIRYALPTSVFRIRK